MKEQRSLSSTSRGAQLLCKKTLPKQADLVGHHSAATPDDIRARVLVCYGVLPGDVFHRFLPVPAPVPITRVPLLARVRVNNHRRLFTVSIPTRELLDRVPQNADEALRGVGMD